MPNLVIGELDTSFASILDMLFQSIVEILPKLNGAIGHLFHPTAHLPLDFESV